MISRYGYVPLLVILLIDGLLSGGVLVFVPNFWPVLILPSLFVIFSFYFFRNPPANLTIDDGLVISPANGKVCKVEECEESEYIHEKSWKIIIFLSVFDVHVNSSPVAGDVELCKHVPGKKLNALDPRSSLENEYSLVGLKMKSGIKIVVKQVAGLIARRIVCDTKEGVSLSQGQVFGMIRFGSRAEVCVPISSGFKPSVKEGDRVVCGVSALGKFREA